MADESKELTLADAVRLKTELDETIRDALIDFSLKTGFPVQSIDLRVIEVIGSGAVTYHVDTSVPVRITIKNRYAEVKHD